MRLTDSLQSAQGLFAEQIACGYAGVECGAMTGVILKKRTFAVCAVALMVVIASVVRMNARAIQVRPSQNPRQNVKAYNSIIYMLVQKILRYPRKGRLRLRCFVARFKKIVEDK